MSFTSLSFLLLLAATLAVYFVLPKKWRWAALLAARIDRGCSTAGGTDEQIEEICKTIGAFYKA